jgi:cellulose synthase/poly-beta-1,6-N-acetylglucosamine synthase-like glycosyltransferase
MLRKFILNHERGVQRFLEILPGFVSWNLILFPYWGIMLIPNAVAYFILTYNIYWFYQSFQIAITGIISHLRIQASMQYDWVKDLKKIKNWEKVQHFVIIPTYKEPIHILERTFESLAGQTIPKKHLNIIFAMEKKEDEAQRLEKVKILKKKYSSSFANLFVTVHELVPGEIAGKSSNEKHAAIWVKENFIDKGGADFDYAIVTSCDADHKYHHNHFAELSYKFLTNKKRYFRFWQPAVLFYNNIWRLPALTRTQSTLSSIWNLSQLPRKDRLISTSNYSLSFKLLHKAEYWDPDKIPEDWGIFFKSYYATKGKVEAEPIYLPVYADAAESTTWRGTITSHYSQRKRWAWGVSDTPWMITKYLTIPGVPFLDKTLRLLYVLQGHFFGPVHWFAITVGLQIPTLLNPRFGRTALGFTVPKVSSYVLSIALIFLVVMLLLDRIYKPEKPKEYPVWRAVIQPIEFFLMPIAGFLFSALPGIDAHTRLMLGKYIEYKVTEKV